MAVTFDVVPATQADLAAGARLMAASFAEPMLPIFHDSTSESMMAYRASQLQRFLVAQAQGTHPPTRFLVARDRDAHADEPLLGLVVWQVLHEPQVEGSQDSEKGGVLPKTAPMPHDSDEEAFAALKREAQAALDRCTQGRPVCYVPYLIVAPHAQRRGVGAALMARALAHAKEGGRLCYLDAAPTPSAEPFYRKLGFVAHGWFGSTVQLLAMTWEM